MVRYSSGVNRLSSRSAMAMSVQVKELVQIQRHERRVGASLIRLCAALLQLVEKSRRFCNLLRGCRALQHQLQQPLAEGLRLRAGLLLHPRGKHLRLLVEKR